MDVMNVEQAKIAEEAGACAVMALGGSQCALGALLNRV
jgi:pyridoxal biosynthesis lyase PdxS